MMKEQIEWIAVDWGTSNLRVWIFGPQGELIEHGASDKGMSSLAPDEFEAALLELIAAHLPRIGRIPVICSGMVGTRQGWREAPYAAVPCKVPGFSEVIRAKTGDARLCVYILPGIMQKSPVDVMRGEETQIGGFLAANPGFDGVLCLPGTHSKWVRVSASEIVGFRTFMTGELFALLSGQSVLRHSLAVEGWDGTAFLGAVNDAITSPKDTLSRLFSLRADSLINASGSDVTRARLSGLLLGLELAGARNYWLGQDVAIIGEKTLSDNYATALAAQGVTTRCEDGSAMSLAGLVAAFSDLKEQRT